MQPVCPPLSWPSGWDAARIARHPLSWVPFVGPRVRAARDIRAQLRARDRRCADLWGPDPERRRVSDVVCHIIAYCMGWPNDCFIPEDPVEILLWEDSIVGLMRPEQALLMVEEQLGITFEEGEEVTWSGTLGEMVDSIVRRLRLRDAPPG